MPNLLWFLLSARVTAQTYSNLGTGKCISGSYRYIGVATLSASGRTCLEECNLLGDCCGFSSSIFNNCLLWTSPGLTCCGNEVQWGSCLVKETSQCGRESSPPLSLPQPPPPQPPPQPLCNGADSGCANIQEGDVLTTTTGLLLLLLLLLLIGLLVLYSTTYYYLLLTTYYLLLTAYYLLLTTYC